MSTPASNEQSIAEVTEPTSGSVSDATEQVEGSTGDTTQVEGQNEGEGSYYMPITYEYFEDSLMSWTVEPVDAVSSDTDLFANIFGPLMSAVGGTFRDETNVMYGTEETRGTYGTDEMNMIYGTDAT